MPLFPLPEHKIGIFVRFCPSEPSFSGLSSTKSGFLCVFTLRNPSFQAFRAQNRGFCALLPSETLVFGLPEHKIGVFVRFCQQVFPIMVFMGSLASSIFPMAVRHSAPACFFPMAIRLSAASLFASAPWPATFSRWRSATAAPLTRRFATAPRPATNLIRRRKVLRFG